MKIDSNLRRIPRGRINVPGDKSISHRSVILASIAKGRTRISNFLPSLDCLSTLYCLERLGVSIERKTETELVIDGNGRKCLSEPKDFLYCGNSGSTARMLLGLLAGQNFFSVLSGDDSLIERPMGRITEPLQEMGARIMGRENGTKLPIAIKGGNLHGIKYNIPVASAQVKSALLLAGLYAEGTTEIIEPFHSRDHTERIMELMGVNIIKNLKQKSVLVENTQELKGVEIKIPGDFSSSAFFIGLSCVIPGSKIEICDVGINPTRTGFLNVLKRMGAKISLEEEKTISGEPRCSIIIEGASLIRGVDIYREEIPTIVDELPIFAVIATQAEGRTEVYGAEELRVKETDRIHVLVTELKKMGAKIQEKEDGFIIEGPTPLCGTVLKSYGDHRIAMALSIAGILASGETIIEDSKCIDISFPKFEETLNLIL